MEVCIVEGCGDIKVLIDFFDYFNFIVDVLFISEEYFNFNWEEIIELFKGWFWEVDYFFNDEYYF